MKIALLGGSFDPPHNSHIKVAEEVLQDIPEIDQVWLLPDNEHHWKPLQASVRDRLAMLHFLENEKIKICDVAIRQGGKTFTINVIRDLQVTTPHTYIWVCGADQLQDFHKWNDFAELEDRMQFVVYPRIGYAITNLLPKHTKVMTPNSFIATDDSSTEIRERIKKGLSIDHLVPEKVGEYIREKRLYR